MAIQRGSDRTGPMRDDARAAEVRDLHSGHEAHAHEWKEKEPSGEDQLDVDYAPNTDLGGQPPDGMTDYDVAVRSALARHLGRDVYPAGRDALLRRLAEDNAPDRLMDLASELPDDKEYRNVGDVVRDLRMGTEAHRF